jgi:hypothetical protein
VRYSLALTTQFAPCRDAKALQEKAKLKAEEKAKQAAAAAAAAPAAKK